MQVSVESGEGLERRMTVTLPPEQIDEEVDKRLKHIARTVRLDGFRPGKVPFSIIKQRYSGSVRQEVFGELVQSSFFEAVKQVDLNPVGEPSIEPVSSDDDGGMGYTAVFDVFPTIELADLGDVRVTRPVAEITDADVAGMVEKLRNQRVTWNQVDRPAADGDQVKIDFKGLIDGEPFEGGSADDVPLVLGSKGMIGGFEEGLIGTSAGESRTLELSFPQDYRVVQLAGKPATFEVRVSAVSEPVLPEADDEFAKSFGITEGGVEGLKEDIRANMARELEQRIKARLKAQVMDALLEKHKVDAPASLVEREISRMREQAQREVAGSSQAGNLELPREIFEDEAHRRVSLGLIVNAVLEKNEIELDADRVRQTIEHFAAEYEDPEEVVQWYLGNREQLATVESLVMEEQVVDWALEQVSLDDEPTSFAALTEE